MPNIYVLHSLLLAGNPFEKLKKSDSSLDQIYTQTKALGQDIYTLLMWTGLFSAVISLVAFAGFKFLIQGNGATPRLKYERKEKFKWIFISVFLMSVLVMLFGAVKKMADLASFQNMGGW